MYTEFYRLREKPFNITPDPSFLYLSSKHQMAITYLEYALMDAVGFVLLTGEIGAGKTTIIRKLLSNIEKDIEMAVVFNTNVSPEQLLELILTEFDLEPSANGKAGNLDILNQFLIEKYSEGGRVVLIVDEAQNLSPEALEEVRMISNLQSDKEMLVQIVLVGQPGLRTKLYHPSLSQLRQRIAVSYHLAPLSLDETKEYVLHRLRKSGAPNNGIFSTEAIEYIFEHSRGVPRTINILCDAALLYGYADAQNSIDKQVIEQVLGDRRDTGCVSALTDVEEIRGVDEPLADDTTLLHKVHKLEEQVAKLAIMVDWQTQENERREESYKDVLIQKFERLLAEERKRSDAFLIRYNQIRHKLNSLTNKEK